MNLRNSRHISVICLLFTAPIVGLAPPVQLSRFNPSATQTVNQVQPNASINVTTIATGFPFKPSCKSSTFGLHLNKGSCIAAWQTVPTGPVARTYGWRNSGVYDVPLPKRYLSRELSRRLSMGFTLSSPGWSTNKMANIHCSADGLCAIDISTGSLRGTIHDIMSDADLSESAALLVRQCVTDRKKGLIPMGGSLGGLGTSYGFMNTFGSHFNVPHFPLSMKPLESSTKTYLEAFRPPQLTSQGNTLMSVC